MRHRARTADVLLVCPPWGRADMPSLICGNLKSTLRKIGAAVAVSYMNLDLAAALGRADYEELSDGIAFLGDALFAETLDDRRILPGAADSLAESLASRYFPLTRRDGARSLRELAARARPGLRDFVASLARRPFPEPGLVLFACERDTFNQTVPAAAIAKVLKGRWPAARIALCGPAVDPPMGQAYLDAFEWLDLLILGDPEGPARALVRDLRAGGPGRVPGVSTRHAAGTIPRPAGDLDRLPLPDFDEYFSQRDSLRRAGSLVIPDVRIPFEGSRGCWWGERSHCAFCNLNDETIAFRSKSPKKLLREMTRQSKRHHALQFCARDNALPREHLDSLLPSLEDMDLSLSYEAKPAMDRSQVEALARSGIREIQSGLETFNSKLLRQCGKGGWAMQNILFMKWCRYYGIRLLYYFIHGFPGETAEDYEQLIGLVPKLAHLPPPLRFRKLDLYRYSPHFNEAARFGFRSVRPSPEYEHVLPSSVIDWGRAAYLFDFELKELPGLSSRRARLGELVGRWMDSWRRPSPPSLEYRKGADFVVIHGSGAGDGRVKEVLLEGARAWVYDFCGPHYRTEEEISRAAHARGHRLPEGTLRSWLAELDAEGLLYSEGTAHLSLALPYRRSSRTHDLWMTSAGAAASLRAAGMGRDGRMKHG